MLLSFSFFFRELFQIMETWWRTHHQLAPIVIIGGAGAGVHLDIFELFQDLFEKVFLQSSASSTGKENIIHRAAERGYDFKRKVERGSTRK